MQHQPFQLYLLRLEIQLDKLHQNDGEEGAGTERRKNCGKIQTYSSEPVFNCSGKFLIRERSDCIQKPGKLTASRKPESRVTRNSKPDAASSSQVKLKDAFIGGLMEKVAGKSVATDENQSES